jgi:hypothetical protein
LVIEYLASNVEITNKIARELTGIRSENTMKEVFYSLRDVNKIERVPAKFGNKPLGSPFDGYGKLSSSPQADPGGIRRARRRWPTR